MIPSHKILRQFAAIEELFLLDMIVREELLQEQIPSVFFVSEHHHNHTRIPKSALRRGDTFGNQRFHDSHAAQAVQIHAEDAPNDIRFFWYDGENTVSYLVTVHLKASRNTLLELLPNSPLAVFGYVSAFFLEKRSEDREHQLSVPAHGINLLFLKVNAYAHFFKHAHRFQQCDRISGKARNGFDQYHIDLTGPAVTQHPLKLRAVFFGAGQPFIGVNTGIFPFWVALDQIAVVADLCCQRMKHGVFTHGNTGIGCYTLESGHLYGGRNAADRLHTHGHRLVHGYRPFRGTLYQSPW